MIYTYDGTFNGFLNLIVYLAKNKIMPNKIKDNNYTNSLLEEIISPNISFNNISDLVTNKIGVNCYVTMYYAFLSNNENRELIIYYYFLNALKFKDKTNYLRNVNCIAETLSLSRRVKRENHKFKGFTRFRSVNNILYAQINPTNNIIYILCNHFKKRLKDEYFIIKDVNRNLYAFYNKKNIYILDDINIKDLDIKTDEIEDLWKSFYNTIGIKERKNDRCRMNFMPKKYWKYILEVENEEIGK